MKRNKISLTIFTTLFILLFICQISYGKENIEVNKNVYLVIVNRLTLLDIDQMPKLNSLIDKGNIGLMNVRGPSGYKSGDSFATINASAKAYASNKSSQFHNLNEEYKEIYENRLGFLDGYYAIGNLQMARLYNQNEKNNYAPYLGALGDNIHRNGLKTAILGNSDTDEATIRTGALIPMDSKGLIDYGNLDDILIEDRDYPYGIKTDYEKILKELEEIKSKASLIVIDTGDLNRLNSYSSFLSMDTFKNKRNLILGDIDRFIGNLVENLDKEKSLLIVLSPNSGEDRVGGSKISPIILWGNNIEKGTISSCTTNRDGIISNLDIAPTIASFLNVSTENMSGNPIKSLERDKALNYINSINGRINTTSKVRTRTLLIYGIISIIIMLIIISLLFLNIRIDNKIGKLFRTLLFLLYVMPIIFILNTLFPIDGLLKFILSLVIITGGFVFLSLRYNNYKIMYFISFSYFIVIAIDLFLNGTITRFSILSHDPIIGARYFGLGNEMVGVFLAATALMSGLLFSKYNNKILSIFILLLSVIIVGHPRLGANVGGTIAISVLTLCFSLEIIGKQLSLKNTVFIAVTTGLIIVILGYIDIHLNPNITHLGKTLVLLKEKGIGMVQNIINRKLLMNIKLVGASIWTKVLFINLFIQIVISYLSKDKIEKLINTGLGKGILSGIAGSIIGFLLNDSGVMLSAIAMNLITTFLLFIMIDEEIYVK